VVGKGPGISYQRDAYARLKTCEFKKVAPIEWQVLNLSLTHTALYRKFAGVDARCLADHLDLFFDRSRPQSKIDRQVVPYTQREMLHLRAKPRCRSRDLILARLEIS